MAAGRVCTGYSKPYVALYSATGGTVTYSSGQILARGVSVSASAESADDNNFYADNVLSESENGVFTSGELTMTVDGLLGTAEKLIMGLPASTSGFTDYDDDQAIPDVGVGFIARYMSGGVVTYVPYIFPRCQFSFPNVDAATQEENIDWQTTELTATIKRSENAKRTWKKVGDPEDTEAAAEAAIKTFFSIT